MKCQCCGCEVDGSVRPRSLPQLRRYFALVRAAFQHWPETCEVQFAGEEECRRHMQMRAGWREVGARIPLVGVNPELTKMIVRQAIAGAKAHAWPVVHGRELVIWTPRSIAFHKMGPREFTELSDAVSVVIKDMTGLDAEQLIKESEHAA